MATKLVVADYADFKSIVTDYASGFGSTPPVFYVSGTINGVATFIAYAQLSIYRWLVLENIGSAPGSFASDYPSAKALTDRIELSQKGVFVNNYADFKTFMTVIGGNPFYYSVTGSFRLFVPNYGTPSSLSLVCADLGSAPGSFGADFPSAISLTNPVSHDWM